MKNFKKIFFFVLSLVVLLPAGVLAVDPPAQDNKGLLYRAGQTAGYQQGSEQQLSSIVGKIIYGALGLLGVVFLVLIVFAGYLWLTAGGEEAQVEKAKGYIKNGVIGLVIVLTSFGITNFVLSSLINSAG
jgi:hypothetical protein